MKPKNNFNKKSQVFIIGIVIIITGALITSGILLNYQFKDKTNEEHMGTYQSGMVDALIAADKYLVYNDLASKYAANRAVFDFAENGGMSPTITEGDAISSGFENFRCGRYGYVLWSNEKEKCFLKSTGDAGASTKENIDFEENFNYYFNNDQNTFITNYKSDVLTTETNTYNTFIDNSINPKINTKIYGFADSQSKVDVFKNANLINDAVNSGLISRGDISGVEFRPAPASNFGSRGGKKIDSLVIHYTAGIDINGALSRLLQDGSKASSNYIVGNTGDNLKVLQLVKDSDRAYHAGCTVSCSACPDDSNDPQRCYPCKDAKFADINSRSIGIEIVNLGNDINTVCSGAKALIPPCSFDTKKCFGTNANTDCWEQYPELQMKKLVALSALLIKKYNIPIDREHIIGHEEITACKIDPGKAFNWDKFIADLKEAVLLDDNALILTIKATPAQLTALTTPNNQQILQPSEENQVVQQTTTQQIELSTAERADIDNTEKRLSEGKLMDNGVEKTWLQYIEEAAEKEGIPKEILLGKITQESRGFNSNIKIPDNMAIGIVQVEGWQHYSLISKVCGKEYVSECNNQYKTCTFTKFHDDVKCQIDTAVSLLKQNYNTYSDDARYEKAVVNNCKIEFYQKKYLSYTGWQRALRAYNGFSCAQQMFTTYVDSVMTYAVGWGYVDTTSYVLESSSQINKGLIGTYSFKPEFAAETDFNFELYKDLADFTDKTMDECRISDKTKSVCLQEHIIAFNAELRIKYPDAFLAGTRTEPFNIELKQNCETPEVEEILNFISAVDECTSSSKDACGCPMPSFTINPSVKIESDQTGTSITFTDSKGLISQRKFGLNYQLKEEINGKFITGTKKLSELKLTKNKNILTLKDSSNKCDVAKNKFRLCLTTSYKNKIFENNKLIDIPIAIKFAITIRDNVPPAPVKDISLQTMQHSKNSIFVSWTKSPEADVTTYKIYLGNSETDFKDKESVSKLNYRTLDVSNYNYAEISSIDLSNPICEMSYDETTNEPYCKFMYATTGGANNANNQIELQKNKLYYISSTNKFMYVLDGSDSNNNLVTGTEKYVAINAIDADLNEQYVFSKDAAPYNLESVVPEDSLESGIVMIKEANFYLDTITHQKTVDISWQQLTKNIDGTPLTQQNIEYKIYKMQIICPMTSCDITGVTQANWVGTTNNLNLLKIDVSSWDAGTYMIAVTSSFNQNPSSEYKKNVIVKEIIIG